MLGGLPALSPMVVVGQLKIKFWAAVGSVPICRRPAAAPTGSRRVFAARRYPSVVSGVAAAESASGDG